MTKPPFPRQSSWCYRDIACYGGRRRKGRKTRVEGWKYGFAIAALLLSTRLAAKALGPHEILVLVNENSARSLAIANHFVHARAIPGRNVVYLDLPEQVMEPRSEMSPREFTRYIWNPARLAIRERGLDHQILAWVYSVDFPIRVTTHPAMSLQGITFVRNDVPRADLVEKGMFLSPLFAGPDRPRGPREPSRTLEACAEMLGARMPLPSMMLGYMGARGVSRKFVLQTIGSGVDSTTTYPPTGGVFFVWGKDVRSTCRAWQYPETVEELEQLGIRAEQRGGFPENETILGLQMGLPWVNPWKGNNRYAAGAMAEHLTSAAAYFHDYDQTKVSAWFRAGVTASAGTVTEPYAIWTKFPHVRFFAHYGRGCSMLESFFLSLRCPLQILLLGEPLAAPWSPPFSVKLQVESDDAKDTITWMLSPPAHGEDEEENCLFLLDDRVVQERGPQRTFQVEMNDLSPGYHEMRAVVYRGGLVARQAFALKGFTVARGERSIAIDCSGDQVELPLERPSKVLLQVKGNPEEITLLKGEHVVARKRWDGDNTIQVDPSRLGEGPQRLQAIARFRDGIEARSRPVPCVVKPVNHAPDILGVDWVEEGDVWRLYPRANDKDGDTVTVEWSQRIALNQDQVPFQERVALGGAQVISAPPGIQLKPGAKTGLYLLAVNREAPLHRIETEVLVTPGRQKVLNKQRAGLVFNYHDEGTYSFFGINGRTSAWMFGRYRKGKLVESVERGAPIRTATWYRLAVAKATGGGVVGVVDGHEVCRWEDGRLEGGGCGLKAEGEEAGFKDVLISPPCLSGEALEVSDGVLSVRQIDQSESDESDEIELIVRDNNSKAVLPVPLKHP